MNILLIEWQEKWKKKIEIKWNSTCHRAKIALTKKKWSALNWYDSIWNDLFITIFVINFDINER